MLAAVLTAEAWLVLGTPWAMFWCGSVKLSVPLLHTFRRTPSLCGLLAMNPAVTVVMWYLKNDIMLSAATVTILLLDCDFLFHVVGYVRSFIRD